MQNNDEDLLQAAGVVGTSRYHALATKTCFKARLISPANLFSIFFLNIH